MPPKTTRPPEGTFALALLMHRERLGLTVKAMCELFGMSSRRTWENFENGVTEPPDWVQRLMIDKLAPRKFGLKIKGK